MFDQKYVQSISILPLKSRASFTQPLSRSLSLKGGYSLGVRARAARRRRHREEQGGARDEGRDSQRLPWQDHLVLRQGAQQDALFRAHGLFQETESELRFVFDFLR